MHDLRVNIARTRNGEELRGELGMKSVGKKLLKDLVVGKTRGWESRLSNRVWPS
jgi:CHAD domain-containing protein